MIGIDNDPARLGSVRDGTMPFEETGAQELLDRVSASGRLTLSERVADAAGAKHIVITLGTPSFSHIEIDMRDIRSALDDLLGALRPGHALTLRSTVAPGTTEFVAGYLAKHRGFQIGEDVYVAHAPERIAAGRFLEEIDSLPCIVGGVGARSGEVVAELFGVFGAPIVQTTPVQAELAKIWANILRYTPLRAAQPADDGLRALWRQRVRGDRPRQPRLPAWRPGPAGAHGRHLLCARTSPSPRSAPMHPECCSRSRV